MAESAVEFLINHLSTLLRQESALLAGLEPDVQYIKGELGFMKAFLRDAEALMDDNNISELQEWVRQVREVAYDTEDVLDDFVFRFAHHHADGFCGSVQKIYTSIKNLKARRQISSEIKAIKARVGDISAGRQRYQSIYGTQVSGSSSSHVANAGYDIRAHSLLNEEAKLVGIDKPKKELISHILDRNSHLKVISVVGMGGLGKTTLVKKVYDDIGVKKQFQSHAWLTISQNFQITVVLKSLIQQLYDEIREPVPLQVEAMDFVSLSAFVKEFLKERRYILVLDDVWSLDSWEAFRHILPDCNFASRVMLTTRIDDVASVSCLECHDYAHKMNPLSDEESWTLFCNRIFQDDYCPPYLEEVSRRILKKCEGLPLAIVAMSGVLALKNKDRIDEWRMMLRSLGGKLEGSTGILDRIKRILLLSYNDLPHYLKYCLLYLSIYPENFQIGADDLLDKWIALGFVHEKEVMASTDVAMTYLKELINRSLIQVTHASHDGKLLLCGLHDFLREIIVSKSKEQSFTTIATAHYTRWPEKVRHLAIHGFTDNPQDLNRLKSLRSMEIFGCTEPLTTSVLSKFLRGGPRFLKVLDLRGAQLSSIPNEVFQLFHLKYLGLSGTGVKIIPKSIGNLQNLEFLDLHGTSVTEVPVEVLKLRKLRSIKVGYFGDCSDTFAINGFKSPDGIGKLISLEYLAFIKADSERIIIEIGKLKQLRTLFITKLRREDGKELLSSLLRLNNLEHLSVSSIKEDETLDLHRSIFPRLESLRILALAGHLERVPQWVISLQALTTLSLDCSGLTEDDAIRPLGDLPNLVSFSLNRAYEGETLSFMAGGFRKLKILELVNLKRLKQLRAEEDSMPILETLTMVGCKQVEGLPLGIQNLRKLESLSFLDMSDELIQQFQNLDKKSVDFRRIAHIPEVCIGYWINGRMNRHYL